MTVATHPFRFAAAANGCKGGGGGSGVPDRAFVSPFSRSLTDATDPDGCVKKPDAVTLRAVTPAPEDLCRVPLALTLVGKGPRRLTFAPSRSAAGANNDRAFVLLIVPLRLTVPDLCLCSFEVMDRTSPLPFGGQTRGTYVP